MATALLTVVPNPNLIGCGPPLGRSPYLLLSRSLALPVRHLDSVRPALGARLLPLDRRFSRLVPLVSQHEESKHSDAKVKKEQDELEAKIGESQEAWKQMVESLSEEAAKLKEKSQEAYEVYSKQAMVTLQETSVKLKIQAEKTRQELSVLAKEMGEEGKEYIASAAQNSPDEVKDIIETFTSVDELKHLSAVRDFHVGIPYGVFLTVGGFLSFMVTGSIGAIRFGVILGSALLALAILSLRLWKSGKSSPLHLKGQAAIATILFIREWRLFSQWRSFPSFLMTLFSGAILAFYIYRIMMDGLSQGPRSDQEQEQASE